jgi:hypothetical protein
LKTGEAVKGQASGKQYKPPIAVGEEEIERQQYREEEDER